MKFDIVYFIYLVCCIALAHLSWFYLRKNKELINLAKITHTELAKKVFLRSKYYLAIILISGVLDVIGYFLFKQILGIFFIAPFFYIQCYSDIETKTVYITLNRLFLAFSLIFFVLSKQYIWLLADVFTLSFVIIVFLMFAFMTKLKRLGMGDFVTIISFLFLYLSLAREYNYYYLGILCFLDFILFSYLPFNVYGWIKFRKIPRKERKKQAIAFYPFMLIGSILTTIITIAKAVI